LESNWMTPDILRVGSLVKIKGGPKQFIKKIGLIVFYDDSYEDAFAYRQDGTVLCYNVLIGEECEWLSRNELECIDAEI